MPRLEIGSDAASCGALTVSREIASGSLRLAASPRADGVLRRRWEPTKADSARG